MAPCLLLFLVLVGLVLLYTYHTPSHPPTIHPLFYIELKLLSLFIDIFHEDLTALCKTGFKILAFVIWNIDKTVCKWWYIVTVFMIILSEMVPYCGIYRLFKVLLSVTSEGENINRFMGSFIRREWSYFIIDITASQFKA